MSIRAAALVLAAALCACSGENGESAGDAPVAEAPLAAAPRADSLDELDPEARELIAAAADALDAAIDDPALWTELGAAYHANRRFTLARTCYAQRLLRNRFDARTWLWLALVDEELGDTADALAHLEEAARLAPGHAPAHWRRGFLHLARAELDEAAAAMERALEVAPTDPAAVVGMARVRLQQGAHDEALRLLEAHLGRYPDDANARFLLGTAYQRAGRTEDADRALAGGTGAQPLRHDAWEDELLTRRRGFRTDFLAATALLDGGDVEGAAARLEELRAQRPDDVLVLINLHRAERLRGDVERAVELLLEASRIDPGNVMVHLHLAGARRDQAGASEPPDPALLGEALESARRACELNPTFADAHGLRGDVLLDLGRGPEAVEAWARAAELDRDSRMWQRKTGEGLCALGAWERALPFLRRLRELDPESPQTLYFLSAALANSGKLEEALEPARRARELAPDDERVRSALEGIERALGAARESDG